MKPSRTKLEYTFAKTFKQDALQVQAYKDDSDHPDPVFNIRRLKKTVACTPEAVEDNIFEAKHYDKGRVLVQYNKNGVVFYPTSKTLSALRKGSKNVLLWHLDKKESKVGEPEFKVVDYTTGYTVGKWKKSRSEEDGWTFKKTNRQTGEKMVLARYYGKNQHLDVFPHNFVDGSDQPVDSYYSHLKLRRAASDLSQGSGSVLSKASSASSVSSDASSSSESSGEKLKDEPFTDQDRVKLSEAIVFLVLSLRLHINSDDANLVIASSLSTPCALSHPELFLRPPSVRVATVVAKKAPVVLRKVFIGGMKR